VPALRAAGQAGAWAPKVASARRPCPARSTGPLPLQSGGRAYSFPTATPLFLKDSAFVAF